MGASATAPLTCQADKFDIPAGVRYLRCSASAPMLKSGARATQIALQEKSQPWTSVAGRSFEDIEVARDLFALLIHTSADRIALIPSASYGLAVAAQNVPIRPGSGILMLEEQFPSNVYVWRERARSCGANIVTVPRPSDQNWTAAVLEHVTPDIAVVALPTCHWLDGTRVDVAQIAPLCKEAGAALVIDASQTLGVLPFDASKIQPDFMVTVSEKWMLGAPQVAFLCADAQYAAGQPLEFNWMNRAGCPI